MTREQEVGNPHKHISASTCVRSMPHPFDEVKEAYEFSTAVLTQVAAKTGDQVEPEGPFDPHSLVTIAVGAFQ